MSWTKSIGIVCRFKSICSNCVYSFIWIRGNSQDNKVKVRNKHNKHNKAKDHNNRINKRNKEVSYLSPIYPKHLASSLSLRENKISMNVVSNCALFIILRCNRWISFNNSSQFEFAQEPNIRNARPRQPKRWKSPSQQPWAAWRPFKQPGITR